MINALIIQSEFHDLEKMSKSLREASMEINVVATFTTVKASIEYIVAHPYPDIIFSDIDLNDGPSSRVFSYTGINVPIIFIGEMEKLKRFCIEPNAIDYLIKPIKEFHLKQSLLKYSRLKAHFLQVNSFASQDAMIYSAGKYKNRLLLKQGSENIVLRVEDVTMIYTVNKIVFVLDYNSKKYISDESLGELEGLLNPAVFFRANRQHIVNINYIKSFRSLKKVKILINIHSSKADHAISISQNNSRIFRKWMQES